MTHPIPDRCRELGTLFLCIDAEPSEKSVNMFVGTRPSADLSPRQVEGMHFCGTTSCFAGWFDWAKGNDPTTPKEWADCATELAKFVGEIGSYQLKTWAEENPVLWGNEFGYKMFTNRKAFAPHMIVGELTLEEFI